MDPIKNLEEQKQLVELSKTRGLTDYERTRLYDLTEAMAEWAAQTQRVSEKEEGVIYTPEGVKIIAVVEMVFGHALIRDQGVRRDPDGEFSFEYADEFKADWNTQAPWRDSAGRRQFVDENYELWTEDQLLLK